MVDVWWVVVAQLVVTLWLAWRNVGLADGLEKTQIVLGHMILEVEKLELKLK
jgi:hypothetical protein